MKENDFEIRPEEEARLTRSPNAVGASDFKSDRRERQDWTLFRSVATIGQKAGVAHGDLRKLCLKEITDNALDAAGNASITPIGKGYLVADMGGGIDGTDEEIARLFSIDRPLVSSKVWRRPLRGALGNGLRVVAGALIASGEGARLAVTTRRRRITIEPLWEGGARVVSVEPQDKPPAYTSIEIAFGGNLPEDRDCLLWAQDAILMAGATKKRPSIDRPSAWFYDSDAFQELVRGEGDRPVREFVARFDGCSGAKAAEVAFPLGGRRCRELGRRETDCLPQKIRDAARPVSHARLGYVGEDFLPDFSYVRQQGTARIGGGQPAVIPFVVEAWAREDDDGGAAVFAFVNGSPITGDIFSYQPKKDRFRIHGCNMSIKFDAPTQKGDWTIYLNVITLTCRSRPMARNQTSSPSGRKSARPSGLHLARRIALRQKPRAGTLTRISSRGICRRRWKR